MSNIELHTLQSAPDAAKPLLEKSVKAFGMVPNLHAAMAGAPALLEGYQVLHGLAQKTSFDKQQLTVVWQTINVEHQCHYCVPAHTAIAKGMGVDDSITQALRDNTPFADKKLEVLRNTTLAIVRDRGVVGEQSIQDFYDAGFSQQQLLEIILILAQKVMSNYVNHIADTPIDEPFKAFAWK